MTPRDPIKALDRLCRVHVSPQDMKTPSVLTSPAAPDSLDRILLYKRGQAIRIIAPEAMIPFLTERRAEAGHFFDPNYWMNTRHPRIARIIGPAYLGYLSAEHFRPARTTHQVRCLAEDDGPALAALCLACGQEEREHSAIEEECLFQAGVFLQGAIAAAAGAVAYGDEVASMGFITHPAFRRQGHGLAAASRATEEALRRGRVPMWRALMENEASLKTARTLGFQDYATTLSIRLQDLAPGG